jgi:hypothetical protein
MAITISQRATHPKVSDCIPLPRFPKTGMYATQTEVAAGEAK